MMFTHAKLAALWKMEKPDKTAIQAKQKELNVLRDQVQEKMTAFRLEAKKIAPDCPMDMDMGMGYGCCMIPGCMFMGPGAGSPPPPPPAK